jgi:hypothetical protein
MQKQQKKGTYHSYEDDEQQQQHISAEQADAHPSQHGAADEHIGNHMGDALSAHYSRPNQGVETRKILLSVSRSLEDLESGKVSILLDTANATIFRRKSVDKDTQQVVYLGDVSRSQVTAMTLRMYDSSLPILVGAKPCSAKGELPVDENMLKFVNGRGYPVIFKPDSEVMFSILPQPHSAGILLYENNNLVEEYIVKTYGSVRPEDLDMGFSPSSTEPGMLSFEYTKNPLMVSLIRKHRYDLEKEFPNFDYKRLQKDSTKYGRKAVLVPAEVHDKIKRDIAEHAITPLDESTGDLAKVGIRIEWPHGANGSFAGVRSHLKNKLKLDDGSIDAMMHTQHEILIELLVSAVIPGTES